MNLFILDLDPVKAAQLQCNKHIPKMVVESAQMLSTAHRILDGHSIKAASKSGKSQVKVWLHPDPYMNHILYKAVHSAHPCTAWTMASAMNYGWHYAHFTALCDEYTHRYGKVHLTDTLLREKLSLMPKNIKYGPMTPFALAMKSNPECMFKDDPVRSYRAFYQTKQERFKMVWTKREIPEWFKVKETA